MSWRGWLRERLRARPFSGAEDRDLDEELRFHLDSETERLRESGLSLWEARRRARLAFGGWDRVVEETRDARPRAMLEHAWRDVRLGVRGLRRDPLFTLIASLTLAVGIGATTAIFAVANALLLRPIDGVRAAEELVVVRLENDGVTNGGGGARRDDALIAGFSPANIDDLRAAAPTLAGLSGYTSRSVQTRTEGAGAFELDATIVHGDYFGVLGMTPLLGRWFSPEELAPGAAGDVVVISERMWTERFGAATDAIGRSIALNASSYVVVGVAPSGFHGTTRTGSTDVWLPMAAYGRLYHRPIDAADRQTTIGTELVGRLSIGASPRVAEQQLRAALANLIRDYPDANAHLAEYTLRVHEGIGLPVSAREPTKRTMRLLLGVVSVLLLIACANVANLLLFRGVSRRHENAVRIALGASGGRLVQQHLVEGVLLALGGAVAGLAIAYALTAAIEGSGLPNLPPIETVPLDLRVLGFAVGGALLTGVLFTLPPAFAALRGAAADPLRSAGRSVAEAGARLRGSLVLVQVSASLALLVGALMLVRTVRNLDAVDLGFDVDAVHAFGFTPAPQGYDGNAARVFRTRLLDEVSSLVELRSASVASFMPVGDRLAFRLAVPGSGDDPVLAVTNEVSADYFETVGTPIIAGRAFNAREERASVADAPGIILSRTVARTLFGDADAVGRTVELRGFTGTTLQPVIGVAEDVRGHPRSAAMPAAYMPLGTSVLSHGYVIVRSTVPFEQTRALVAGVVARLDPNIPFFTAESLSATVRRTVAEEHLLARLVGLFAVLSIALAAIGIYGVIAYSVARRRHELGIRIALGARADGVIRLVSVQSVRLVLAGCAVGALGGYALSRVLASRMFGVTPLDATTYLIAVAGFAVVALLASAGPAAAATRIDPIESLRQE